MRVMVQAAVLGISVLLSGLPAAIAQDYPNRRIEIIVPYPPGGAPDILARSVAEKVGKSVNQPVIIINRPGAGSDVGSEALAVSKPDGYTIGVLGNPQTIHHLVKKEHRYEFERNFAPITRGVSGFFVLVVNPKKLDVRSVSELVAAAKAAPGKLNFASGGVVTSSHLAGEWFKSAAGVKIEHIPYLGSVAANTATLAGQVDMMFAELGSVSQFLESGELRALAVTLNQREPRIPSVPTLMESGIPVDYSWWLGFVAPAGVNPDIIASLNREITVALRSDEVVTVLRRQGLRPVGDSTEEFKAAIVREREVMTKVIKDAGIEPR